MAKQEKALTITQAAGLAATALSRFGAVEREAQRIHQEQTGSRLVRALLDGSGLHAVITDGKATLEIASGKVAVSVRQEEIDRG